MGYNCLDTMFKVSKPYTQQHIRAYYLDTLALRGGGRVSSIPLPWRFPSLEEGYHPFASPLHAGCIRVPPL